TFGSQSTGTFSRNNNMTGIYDLRFTIGDCCVRWSAESIASRFRLAFGLAGFDTPPFDKITDRKSQIINLPMFPYIALTKDKSWQAGPYAGVELMPLHKNEKTGG